MVLKLTYGKVAEKLNAEEKMILDKITREYFNKISRRVPQIDNFEVHLKFHKKEGDTKRYTIEIRFISGKFRFETNADEWNIADAIHVAMKKLMSEIEHKVVRQKDEKASWKKKARW